MLYILLVGNIMQEIDIENIIYEIRGIQVMLDSDLAELYNCKNGTKEINQAVKNNPNKFSERFSRILSNEEVLNLQSKFLTANISSKSRNNPRVFTEQGVYMLATILKTEVATKTSIKIMDAFVKMRKYFKTNNEILLNHENRLLVLEKALDKFKEKDLSKIFFEGELYDAYSVFLDILNSSKKEIIIIDNYCSKELLDILKDIERKIIIVSKNIDETLKSKYEKQYNNVEFIYNNSIHDRFIIIDRKILYTSGSSFKDIGKKCFYIGVIDNKDNLSRLLKEIEQ